MRKQYIGSVCCYREWAGSSFLYTNVKTECGEDFTYYTDVVGFTKQVFYGGPVKGNMFKASFTANEDGSNPRSIKFIEEIERD